MPRPIRIAAPPAPAPVVDRAALADRIVAARKLAEACLTSVVRTGVMREQGLAVSRTLNERADALQFLLETGAPDADFPSVISGLDWLELDARMLAADPMGIQASHDERATQ